MRWMTDLDDFQADERICLNVDGLNRLTECCGPQKFCDLYQTAKSALFAHCMG